MPNNDYWKKRMESIEEMSHKKGMAYTSHIDKQFRLAEKRINQKIEYWYARIAKNNEVSLSAAKEMLRADELEDFHLTVEEYIEKGKTLDFDNRWMQQLENASAKVHIRRLEALQLQMQQECEVLFGNMTDGLDKTLTDVYTSAYYNTAYEFMKGHGVGWAFNKLDIRKIEQAINTAWAYDKKTFKARCWTNKEKLVHELNTTLTQSIIRGESPQKAIDQISKRMKVSRYSAGRLIMTESCAISTMAQKGCYKELGVEKFEFVATLDSSTSDVCRSMDGQIFNMSDYNIGVNVPPLHCFCRSCTVPYYEDDFGSVGERAARGDDGETYNVPANMTYSDWEKQFVKDGINNPKETFETGRNSSKKFITDQSIIKVQSVKLDGYTDEEMELLANKHRELLQIAKDKNNSDEVVGVFSTSFDKPTYILGSENFVYVSGNSDARVKMLKAKYQSMIWIHNHPKGSSFSYDDIGSFLQPQIKTFTIVTNKGKLYCLNKKNDFDFDGLRDKIKEIKSNYTNFKESQSDIAKDILKIISDYGVEYIR